jgi:hypothetical protein
MAVFWDVAPCSQVDIVQCFRRAYYLHHHGDGVMMEAISSLKYQLISTRLHSATSQKAAIFNVV